MKRRTCQVEFLPFGTRCALKAFLHSLTDFNLYPRRTVLKPIYHHHETPLRCFLALGITLSMRAKPH